MSDIYDDAELTPTEGFDNVVFKEVGDRFHGSIVRFDRIESRYGKVAKYWLFDIDRQVERTMLAGSMDLWSQLHKLRPQVGDILTIELVAINGRAHQYMVEVDDKSEPF